MQQKISVAFQLALEYTMNMRLEEYTDHRKPCSHCGSKLLDTSFSETFIRDSAGPGYVAVETYAIKCRHCLATGPKAESHAEAVELWNIRYTPRKKRKKAKKTVAKRKGS